MVVVLMMMKMMIFYLNNNLQLITYNLNRTTYKLNIPVWIKWKGWPGRFYSGKPGDVGPPFENASIESKTPRYFQVDDLYRIAVAEVLFTHIILYRIATTKSLS